MDTQNKTRTVLYVWLIVAVIVVAGLALLAKRLYPGTERAPTSADNAPEGSIHNLPVPEAVAKVRSQVAKDLGVNEGVVIVMSAYERKWSDSCLGLGGPAESCLQAITPGYEVTVAANGQEYVYRTNQDGSAIREQN